MKTKFCVLAVFALLISLNISCNHDDEFQLPDLRDQIAKSGYPEDIGMIIVSTCAVSGCHDDQSYQAAAGLNLTTWENLFKGGNGGACVIPYSTDYSTLLYYINHDSILNVPALSPTMPVNNTPLNSTHLNKIYNWIANGAPDKNGFVKFSDNPMRKKYYVTNQGCDIVSIFDASTNLVMRMKSVGLTPLTESPHMVRVASDNLSWWVCFVGGSTLEQYSTLDNSLMSQINIGPGQWNTFVLSPDGSKAYVIDFANGRIAFVDVPSQTSSLKMGFGSPHGSALNQSGDTLYVTAQLASYLFKIPVNDVINYDIIDLIQGVPAPTEMEPHDIMFTPDYSKYFVTCQESNQVRVFDAHTDQLLAVIPVGLLPQELAISTTKPYIFATCTDDIPGPGQRGSVAVINYMTNQFVKSVYSGYQPHGIAVDDVNGKVYVAHRNIDITGPLPHHQSVCSGRNGNVSIIDLNTLTLIPGSTTEISVDPYSIGITH